MNYSICYKNIQLKSVIPLVRLGGYFGFFLLTSNYKKLRLDYEFRLNICIYSIQFFFFSISIFTFLLKLIVSPESGSPRFNVRMMSDEACSIIVYSNEVRGISQHFWLFCCERRQSTTNIFFHYFGIVSINHRI